MVGNKDIGFVHTGQDVAIKVDAFSLTQYGLLTGKVVSLSQDAIMPDRGLKDQAKPQADGDDEKSQPSSYAAQISLDQTQMQMQMQM